MEKDLIGDAVCDWDLEKLLETGGGGDPGCVPDEGWPESGPGFFFFLKKKEKKKEEHKEIQKLKEKIQNKNGHAAHAVFHIPASGLSPLWSTFFHMRDHRQGKMLSSEHLWSCVLGHSRERFVKGNYYLQGSTKWPLL